MSARSEPKRGINVPHDRMLSTLVTAAKLLFDASRNPDFTKDSPFALNALRKATSLSKPYLVRLEQELARHNVETTAPDHGQVRASKAVQFRDVLRKVIKIAQDLSKTRSRRPRESVRLSLLSDVHQFLGLEVARAMREVKRLEHTLEGKHKRRRHRRHRGSTDKPEEYAHHNTGESEGGNAVEISREMVSLTSGASHHAEEEEDRHSTRPDEVKTTAAQDPVRQVPHAVASLASAASHHTVAAAPPQSPNDIIPAEDAAESTHTHHTTPAPSVQLNRAQSHTTPELSDGDEHPRSPPSPSVKSSTHSKEPIPNPVSRTTTRRGSPSTRGTPMPPSETSFDRRISAAHARLDSVEKVLASPSRHDPLSEQNLSRHNFSEKRGSCSKRSKHGSGTKKDGDDERGSKLSVAAGFEQHGSAKGEEEESKGKGEVEGGKTTSRGTGSRASSHHSKREEAKMKSGTSVHASHVSSSSSKGKPKVEDGKTMSSHASSRHSRREEATTMNSGTSVHASHVSSSSSNKGDENKPESSPSATSEQHGSSKSKSSSSSSKGKLKVEDRKTTSSHASTSTSTHHSKLKQATPILSGTSAHASHASLSSSSPSPPPTLPNINKKSPPPSPSSSISSSSTPSTKNSTNNKVHEQKKSESNIVELPEQEAGEGEQQQRQQVLSSFTLEQQQQDEMDRDRERERERL